MKVKRKMPAHREKISPRVQVSKPQHSCRTIVIRSSWVSRYPQRNLKRIRFESNIIWCPGWLKAFIGKPHVLIMLNNLLRQYPFWQQSPCPLELGGRSMKMTLSICWFVPDLCECWPVPQLIVVDLIGFLVKKHR
jgi:hypothetical protein